MKTLDQQILEKKIVLYDATETGTLTGEEVLRISQELDVLIVEKKRRRANEKPSIWNNHKDYK